MIVIISRNKWIQLNSKILDLQKQYEFILNVLVPSSNVGPKESFKLNNGSADHQKETRELKRIIQSQENRINVYKERIEELKSEHSKLLSKFTELSNEEKTEN